MSLNKAGIFVSTMVTSLLNNSSTKYCSERFSLSTCYLAEFSRSFAYCLLALSLLPQIIHLFTYRTRYIAGISYMWIIIRILALTSFLVAHNFAWLSILELIALISTIIIFLQIIGFSNIHRQNKIILIVITISIWIIERILFFFFVKQKHLLITIGYLLFAVQMLPQILLNSLLRTAKALSTFSIFLLAISDILLFSNFSIKQTPFIHLISIYYSITFFLYICLQSLIYSDAHIHLISRSAHTVLTPGVDIFTGLDTNGVRSSGQDPQMFSVDELESMDGSDIIYQAVTTNKSPNPIPEKTPIHKFVWYATLGCLFCIEIIITILLIYRVRSLWIIIVPISIPIIFSIFFLLRTKLGVLQTEYLRKIL